MSSNAIAIICAASLVARALDQVDTPFLWAGGDVRVDGSIFVVGDFVIGVTGFGSPVEQGVVPCWQSASCPADLNGDGEVGLSDLTTLLSNFGIPSGADPNQGDLDGDSDIDISDLVLLLSAFGLPCA